MTHPTTRYAERVCAGEIIAGPYVRAACARHIRDLDRPEFTFDERAANRGIGFFRDVLSLSSGRFEGDPFVPLPWQEFVIGSLLGWKRVRDGYRRFRTAYIETGKGSGKSPLIAGLGIFSIVSDGEVGAQTYLLARTAEQAMPTFRDALSMIGQSRHLSTRLGIQGGENAYNISYPAAKSFFRRVSGERQGKGKSGPIPHFILCDEYHEQDTSDMLDIHDAGKKHRAQPLTIITTNAGAGKNSPCGIEHDHAVEVAMGDAADDSYFSYVCALDPKDKPFEDESCWIKANPSLPAIPGYEAIREQVQKARGMPSKRAIVERLHFCVWTDAVAPWLDRDRWLTCEVGGLAPEDERKGVPCFAAVDLGLKVDFTAGTLLWDLPEAWQAEVTFWTPADTLKERGQADRIHYEGWAAEGDLVTVPGSILDLRPVAEWLGEASVRWNLRGCAFDQWKIDLLERELEQLGVPVTRDPLGRGILMVPHAQGFVSGAKGFARKQKQKQKRGLPPLWMPRSIDAIEAAILNSRLQVLRNRALRSAALSAVVILDASLNRRFTKTKAANKIDGMVSLTMAGGFAASKDHRKRRSVYHRQGIRTI